MRILLVEDDAMLADAIARALTQAAHAVDLVGNGEDADRALLTTEYDLVLLDIGLPQNRRPRGAEALRACAARRCRCSC